jgi:hypothetical protein
VSDRYSSLGPRRKPLGRTKGLGRGAPLQRSGQLASVTPLRSYTGLQRHQGIRPVSAKRRAENRQRRAMITGLAGGERPLCAVWLLIQPEWCTRWADDAHEPLSRARLGSIVDPENCRFLCRACHDVLTFRPESELQWAYNLGLLRHSWHAGGEVAG